MIGFMPKGEPNLDMYSGADPEKIKHGGVNGMKYDIELGAPIYLVLNIKARSYSAPKTEQLCGEMGSLD